MKWVRSLVTDLETTLATRRGFVHDPEQCEFFYANDYNLYDLFANAKEDIILIEWDLAIDREERVAFEKICLADPENVHVAPYKHYAYKRPITSPWSYMHRRDYYTFIEEGEPFATLFGFGLVYLPLKLIQQFIADTAGLFVATVPANDFCTTYEKHMLCPSGKVQDTYFSYWHWHTFRKQVPVHWEIRPVHLHYDEHPHVFEGSDEMRQSWDNPIVVRPKNAEAIEALRNASNS